MKLEAYDLSSLENNGCGRNPRTAIKSAKRGKITIYLKDSNPLVLCSSSERNCLLNLVFDRGSVKFKYL